MWFKNKTETPEQQDKALRLDWLETVKLSHEDLIPFQNDLKKMSAGDRERFKRQMLRNGFSEPFSVWKSHGKYYVLNGHQRLEIVLELAAEGYQIPKLPVNVIHAETQKEAKEKVLALTSQYGRMTQDAFESFVTDADLDIEELKGEFRVPDVNIDSILATMSEKEVELSDADDHVYKRDDTPEIVKSGDIVELGRHRLMCGDAGDPEQVDTLLNENPVHLVNTDPPYNVKVEPRSNNAIAAGLSSFPDSKGLTHHQKMDLERHPEKLKPTHENLRPKDRPLENDFVSDADFDKLLAAWFGNITRVLLPGHSFYIWGGYANCSNYPPVLKACKLYFSQAIIWVKEHPVMTRKDFMGNHEWCFYGWKLGASHRFFGPDNAVDVWDVKKINPQNMVHLTEKPVELAARAIQYSSEKNDNVLDLFAGSGSTLIAAERCNRRAFLMELDPRYCDVICHRWCKTMNVTEIKVNGETVQWPINLGSNVDDTGDEEGTE